MLNGISQASGDGSRGEEEGRPIAARGMEAAAEEGDGMMLEAPLDLNADISMAEMQMMQAMGIPFVRCHPPPSTVQCSTCLKHDTLYMSHHLMTTCLAN